MSRPERPPTDRIGSPDWYHLAVLYMDALEAENRRLRRAVKRWWEQARFNLSVVREGARESIERGLYLDEAVELLRDARAFMGDLHTGRFGVAVNASYQTGRIDAFLARMEGTNG